MCMYGVVTHCIEQAFSRDCGNTKRIRCHIATASSHFHINSDFDLLLIYKTCYIVGLCSVQSLPSGSCTTSTNSPLYWIQRVGACIYRSRYTQSRVRALVSVPLHQSVRPIDAALPSEILTFVLECAPAPILSPPPSLLPD